jgi:hypothetical protein
MRSVLCVAGVALILVVSQAEAQTCVGAPSFRDKPMQGGLTASFVGERHEVGGTFAAGKPSLFGSVGVLATHISFLGTAPTLTLGVGTEVPSSEHPVFTCPLFQVAFTSGPDVEPFDTSIIGVRGGLSVGAIVAERRAMQVIPTFGLAVLYDRAKVSIADVESTNSVWSGVATFGVGFLFNKNLSVIPALEVPFSAGNSETGFSFRWVYGFGR